MTPAVGLRVMFGHLLLEGERTGTVVAAGPFGATVAVDFLPEDGPSNPPGKHVSGCLFLEGKPGPGTHLPASYWQYCYPLPESL